MGFQGFRPEAHRHPRVRASIFAMNCDMRFSSDQTPYLTYAAVEHQPLRAEVFSDRLVGLGIECLKRLAPLQQWLVDLLPD